MEKRDTVSTQKIHSKKEKEKGQALVEFLLMLVLAMTVVAILSTGFRRSLFRIWEVITREVGAPCPDCAPPGNQDWQLTR
jgi:hypothetical protein